MSLKIERSDILAYRLAYRRPVRWFNSSEGYGTFLALRLIAGGVEGMADVTIKPTWAGLSPRAMAALLEDLYLPALAQVDCSNPRNVQSALAPFPGNALTKTLVVNACAELAAAASGIPIWRASGGDPHVHLSWCVTRQTPREMAVEAGEMVSRHGFQVLKVKGGQGFEIDREALRAIADAVGSDVDLTVDANCAYCEADLQAYLTMLAEEGVVVAEDPVRFFANAKFAKHAAESPIPLLVDTPCTNANEACAFLAAGARALSIKPGRVGMTESWDVLKAAHAAGADVCTGLYAESPLGSLVSLQFSAAIKRPMLPAEQCFFLIMEGGPMTERLVVKDGATMLPDITNAITWSDLRVYAI